MAKGEGEMAEEKEGGSNGKNNKPKAKESATTAETEEDAAWMAYLSDSDSEDHDDKGSVDWWDEPVEGESEGERVDNKGNQPISKLAEPDLPATKVKWPKEDSAGAGVSLHTPYPKSEPTLEY